MPILLHLADLPTPDMAWIATPTALVLVADRRVPRALIVKSLTLAVAWLESHPPEQPDRTAA